MSIGKCFYNISLITQRLKELGPGAMIFTIDIRRTFRHIRIDPKDIDLLGIQHDDAYINASLAFGVKHGSTFFQRCSDAIRHIMREPTIQIVRTVAIFHHFMHFKLSEIDLGCIFDFIWHNKIRQGNKSKIKVCLL